jgi:hypothetical protein
MSIPISKRIIKHVVPASEKVLACCNSKEFLKKGNTFVCNNEQCKDFGKDSALMVPDGVTPTRYKIRSLSPTEHGRLTDEAMTMRNFLADGSGTKPSEIIKLWVKAGLVGWENFEASFLTAEQDLLNLGKRMMITDSAFDEIPYEDTIDIAEAIGSYNKLTDDQRKN